MYKSYFLSFFFKDQNKIKIKRKIEDDRNNALLLFFRRGQLIDF